MFYSTSLRGVFRKQKTVDASCVTRKAEPILQGVLEEIGLSARQAWNTARCAHIHGLLLRKPLILIDASRTALFRAQGLCSGFVFPLFALALREASCANRSREYSRVFF